MLLNLKDHLPKRRSSPEDEVDAAPLPGLGLGGDLGAGITGPKRSTEREMIANTDVDTSQDEKMARELQRVLSGGRPDVDLKADEEAARQLAAEMAAKDAAERADADKKAHDATLKFIEQEKKHRLDNQETKETKEIHDVDSLAAQRILEEDRAKLASERKAREEQSASDYAAALVFSDLAGAPSSDISEELLQFRPDSVSEENWKKMRADLQEILNGPAVIGENNAPGVLTDAHKFTKTLIRAGIPKLLEIDRQCKFSSETLSPAKVLGEIQTFLKKSEVQPERVILSHINGTFLRIAKEAPVDAAETLANAHHILSRTWTLAKKLGASYQGAVATCLSDNIGDKGGCIPGLIARLYAVYAKMIGYRLDMVAQPKAPAKR